MSNHTEVGQISVYCALTSGPMFDMCQPVKRGTGGQVYFHEMQYGTSEVIGNVEDEYTGPLEVDGETRDNVYRVVLR